MLTCVQACHLNSCRPETRSLTWQHPSSQASMAWLFSALHRRQAGPGCSYTVGQAHTSWDDTGNMRLCCPGRPHRLGLGFTPVHRQCFSLNLSAPVSTSQASGCCWNSLLQSTPKGPRCVPRATPSAPALLSQGRWGLLTAQGSWRCLGTHTCHTQARGP